MSDISFIFFQALPFFGITIAIFAIALTDKLKQHKNKRI